MTSPSLSVVLPLYNGERFVQAALESVIKQIDLPDDWEIIVVDDASSDNGANLCKQLVQQHPKIKIESQPVNLGVAATRNRGVALARYEYLGFIDQDDQWEQNKWLLQAQVMQTSKADYVLGYQNFELLNPHDPPHWFRPELLKSPQKAYVFGGILMRKSTFLKVGALQESLIFGYDDVDWFIRAKEMGLKEHLIDAVVLNRYVHERNASARTAQSNPELLYVIREKLARQS